MALVHPPFVSSRPSEDEASFATGLVSSDFATLPATGLSTSPGPDHPIISSGQRSSFSSTNSNAEVSARSSRESSDNDYDALKIDPSALIQERGNSGLEVEATLTTPIQIRLHPDSPNIADTNHEVPKSTFFSTETSLTSQLGRRKSISATLQETSTKGKYRIEADDPELKEVLRRSTQREAEGSQDKQRRSRFSDLVFTRQFTTFDRQNPTSASSPFHGFFTLFWLGTFLLLVKVSANNWKIHGNIFGRHEIMTIMFSRDVLVLGITDGVMCMATSFCILLQKVILKGYLSWNREGWIIQNIWQTVFLGAIIEWMIYRDWPWTHTIFIVLHCLVMLMKQHSYAFYNGHLSEINKKKKVLERKLKQLEVLDPVTSPANSPTPTELASSYFDAQALSNLHRRRRSMHSKSTLEARREESDVARVAEAIESGEPLELNQISSFKRIIQLEIDGLSDELKGKSSIEANHYPRNLNIRNFAEYIPLPTVVYELEYLRQESVNWSYVAEKTAATFGVLCVMIVVSQAFIYPAVMTTVHMKEQGLTLQERLKEFPWILSDLLFPFMMEYLLAWYVIWECVLNVLAELTLFADRGFYADWWNSTSWDQFARDWNRPVHNFLLRHVYHSSISAFRVSRSTATLITFFLSACVHELIMLCLFKKLRGYLMAMQMLQLPLVMLSRTKLLKDRSVLGNVAFWVGIFTGPSFLCSLYLII